MRIVLCIALLVCSHFNYGQEQKSTEDPNEITYSLFLIGDAGEPVEKGHGPNFELLRQSLIEVGGNSGVVFLGDNIYPAGLPSEGQEGLEIAQRIMDDQLAVVKGYNGKSIFLPGNHDWEKGKENGWERVKNQEQYVSKTLGPDGFFPKNGCPGPILVEINSEVGLVILDTQWLLHKHDRPSKADGCSNDTLEEISGSLSNLLIANKDKTVIVASHHPMYTYGPHGGTATFKDHVFPLTMISDWLYVPLPILGTIVQQLRKHKGHIQDTTNKKYKKMRDKLVEVMVNSGNAIHVSGHEHSLQLILNQGIPFVVSGSGSKTTHVKSKKDTRFATSELGFARLDFVRNGGVHLTFFTVDKKTKISKAAFKTALK